MLFVWVNRTFCFTFISIEVKLLTIQIVVLLLVTNYSIQIFIILRPKLAQMFSKVADFINEKTKLLRIV
jgi:hypothetical protein